MNRRARLIPLLFVACLCLSGCFDAYSGPVFLQDQSALAKAYKERPNYSSFYYEGTLSEGGTDSHVFVQKTLLKFTTSKSFTIYYLPLSEITFQSMVIEYAGKNDLRLAHEFSYQHDAGVFELLGAQSESIKANFTEKYSLLEERCINAATDALENSKSFEKVKYAAEVCYLSGNFTDSRKFTILLNENQKYFVASASKGGVLHDYHTLLGRHLLREGQLEEAKNQLLHSVESTPSAVMQSFGPNMSLAVDLLEQGEKEAVLAYLDAVSEFWEKETIAIWKSKIINNKLPSLDIYNWDNELRVRTYKVNDATLSADQVRQMLSGNTVSGYYDNEGWDIRFFLYFAADGQSRYSDYYGEKLAAWEIREDGCMLLEKRWDPQGGCLYFEQDVDEQDVDGSLVLLPGVYATNTQLNVIAGEHKFTESNCLSDFQGEQYESALDSCLIAANNNDR